jgi:hypothetical protein
MWHKAQAHPSQGGAGWAGVGPFQFPLRHHVKEGQCTAYPMPKVGGGRVGWPADHVYCRPARVW